MKTKIKIITFLVLVIAVMITVLTNKTQFWGDFFKLESTVSGQNTSQIPSSILYDQLFRLVVKFQAKAEIQKLTGENVTSLKDYFKDSAKLSDSQNQSLLQTASEYTQAVEPIDAQAREIISQFRKQFQDGWINEGQQAPSPPTELETLQEQRNSLALTYRDNLKNLLGEKAFEEFDEFIQDGFAQNFQAIGTMPARQGGE